jgi:hypothetical protein
MQVSLSTPVAQSPEPNQQSAHEAGEAEGVPKERQVSNLCSSRDSSGQNTGQGRRPYEGGSACVLASAPGAESDNSEPSADAAAQDAAAVKAFAPTLPAVGA